MKAYMMKFGSKHNAHNVLAMLQMSGIDEYDQEYFRPPTQCGFMGHDLVVQDAEYADEEHLIKTKPLIILNGFWLSYHTPNRNYQIENLPHCLRGVDLGLSLIDGLTHEIYAKPNLDLTAVKYITGLPQFTETAHFLGK